MPKVVIQTLYTQDQVDEIVVQEQLRIMGILYVSMVKLPFPVVLESLQEDIRQFERELHEVKAKKKGKTDGKKTNRRKN